jgi:hypothetical protein
MQGIDSQIVHRARGTGGASVFTPYDPSWDSVLTATPSSSWRTCYSPGSLGAQGDREQ